MLILIIFGVQFRSMKNLLLVVGLIILSVFITPTQVKAAGESTNLNDITGEVLCLPDSIHQSDVECELLGPSAYTSRMADLGVTFPLQNVPGHDPDPSLTQVNIRYGEVVRQNARVYASLEDAVKKGQVIRTPLGNISKLSRVTQGVKIMRLDGGDKVASITCV